MVPLVLDVKETGTYTFELSQSAFTDQYLYFFEDKTKGNRRYFTAGLGVKYNIFGLNFSYLLPSGSGVTQNPLSNTLRFSVLFDLDGEAAEE